MVSYIFPGLVIAFICFVIAIAIKWEIQFYRLGKPITDKRQKHLKQTTGISATDVVSTPPGFNEMNNPAYATHPGIASAINEMDSNRETGCFKTNDSSQYNSINSDSDTGGDDSGGFDNGGGYDSGGGGYS